DRPNVGVERADAEAPNDEIGELQPCHHAAVAEAPEDVAPPAHEEVADAVVVVEVVGVVVRQDRGRGEAPLDRIVRGYAFGPVRSVAPTENLQRRDAGTALLRVVGGARRRVRLQLRSRQDYLVLLALEVLHRNRTWNGSLLSVFVGGRILRKEQELGIKAGEAKCEWDAGAVASERGRVPVLQARVYIRAHRQDDFFVRVQRATGMQPNASRP